jgi:hypothetical protein
VVSPPRWWLTGGEVGTGEGCRLVAISADGGAGEVRADEAKPVGGVAGPENDRDRSTTVRRALAGVGTVAPVASGTGHLLGSEKMVLMSSPPVDGWRTVQGDVKESRGGGGARCEWRQGEYLL